MNLLNFFDFMILKLTIEIAYTLNSQSFVFDLKLFKIRKAN